VDIQPFDSVTHFIAAAGALGTAAFGLVEAAKGLTPLGTAGLGTLKKALGPEALKALGAAYGEAGWEPILSGTYRKGSEAVAQTLRNGLRLALDGTYGAQVAKSLALPEETVAQALGAYARATAPGAGVEADQDAGMEAARRALGRVELALDARIQGAVATAEAARIGWLQAWAGAVALGGALAVSLLQGGSWTDLGRAALIGLVAVPVAPLSKDLVSFLQTARTSLSKRGA
jgi:hypothetical protein